MRVIAVSTLKTFWNDHPEYLDVQGPTLAWYRDVLKADWARPSDLKGQFRTASILQDGRAVFNIGGALLGARLALRHGSGFVRGVFVAVAAILIARLGYDTFA